MNLEHLSEVLQLLQNSRVAELELEDEEEGRFLRLRRPQRPPAPTAPATSQSQPSVTIEPVAPQLARVEATLVGRFFFPSRTFEVGDEVKEEQMLGAIESMRLMNPVVAPVQGRVAAIHVEEGQPVEYGQLLFEIEPG